MQDIGVKLALKLFPSTAVKRDTGPLPGPPDLPLSPLTGHEVDGNKTCELLCALF